MPGGYEISRTVQAVQERFGSAFIVLPLHGDLPVNDQDAGGGAVRPAEVDRGDECGGDVADN